MTHFRGLYIALALLAVIAVAALGIAYGVRVAGSPSVATPISITVANTSSSVSQSGVRVERLYAP